MRRWSRPWIRHLVGSVRLRFFDRNPADVSSIKHSPTASSFFPRVHRDEQQAPGSASPSSAFHSNFFFFFFCIDLHWFASVVCFRSNARLWAHTHTHSWNRTKKRKSSTKTNDTLVPQRCVLWITPLTPWSSGLRGRRSVEKCPQRHRVCSWKCLLSGPRPFGPWQNSQIPEMSRKIYKKLQRMVFPSFANFHFCSLITQPFH